MVDFIRVEPLNTPEALLDRLRPQHPAWEERYNHWIFRGQWDAWVHKLVPSAFRADSWVKFAHPGTPPFVPKLDDRMVQGKAELEILKRFLELLNDAGLPVPDHRLVEKGLRYTYPGAFCQYIGDPNLTAFIALAQHHGVPTRLLDWTEVAIRAAYFAATDAAKHAKEAGSLAVWAFSRDFIDEARDERRQESSAYSLSGVRLRMLRAPRASNPNLHAQAGLFTAWWGNGSASLEDVVPALLEDLKKMGRPFENRPVLQRLELPWSEAPKLLRLLAYEQVDALHMFPGRDGVVATMKERALWDHT